MATAFAHRPKLSVSRPMDLDKALPSDEPMEAALLGTIIMDAPWALSELRLTTPNLAPRHFYKALHKKVFAGILELEEAGQAVDMLSLIGWLDDHGVAEAQAIVADLSAQIPMPAHPATYAQRVYDLARQRAQIQTSYKMWLAAWEGNTDEYNELTEKTTKLRDDFVPAKERKLKVKSLRDIMRTEYPEVRMLVEKLVQQGVVTLFAGKAKAGKSFWMLAAAFAVAEASQNAFGSRDQDGNELYHGLHCEQSRVLYMALEDTERRIKNRTLKMRGELAVPEFVDVATEAPRIDDALIAQLDGYLDEHPDCKLIIIDTLIKVLPPPSRTGGYQEDYINLSGLRDLAHRRDVAILPLIHCRKADGTDVFDTIQQTMGTQAAAENLIVLQRRRGEDRAILHATGNDIGDEALAMKFDSKTCTWAILGDADQVAENEQEEQIFGALEALDGSGKLGQIASQLKGEMAFAQVRTMLYRMSAVKPNSPVKNKLVNEGGIFRKNDAIKSENHENIENHENDENPEIILDEETSSQSSQSSHTSQTSQHSQKLIDAETPIEDIEVLRQEALTLWEKHDWHAVQVDGWPRGGAVFTAMKFIENATATVLQALLVALLALGGA